MSTEIRHYAKPLYPGTFVPEEGKSVRIDEPTFEAAESALGFDTGWFAAEISSQTYKRFVSDDGEESWQPQGKPQRRRVYVGAVYDVNEVAALPGDFHILIANMKSNDWARVVRTRAGNWQPIWPGDEVVSEFHGLR